jgi:hypothetical protein
MLGLLGLYGVWKYHTEGVIALLRYGTPWVKTQAAKYLLTLSAKVSAKALNRQIGR